MKSIFYITLLLFSALLPPAVSGAELINFNVTFDDGPWRELLPPLWGASSSDLVERPGNGKALRLKPESNRSTQKFPYAGGTIQVKFDAANTEIKHHASAEWKVGLVQIYYFAGEKELGHQDIHCARQSSDWRSITFERPKFKVPASATHFQIRLSHYGVSGEFLIDNLKISISVPEKNLCGDQGFRGTPGLDHWFPLKEGKDWDRLAFASCSAEVDYRYGVLPGSRALHITGGPATVRSMSFPYNGEELLIGAWYRQQGIVTGSKSWCNAGIQIVLFDQYHKVIGHRDLTPLQPGSRPWSYVQDLLPAGKFGRAVKSFAIYVRSFDGGKGEVAVGEVALIRRDTGDSIPYDKTRAAVTVDATRPEATPIRPVWAGADLSYVHQVNEPPIRIALAGLRAAGVTHLRAREFMNGMHLISGWGDDGKPIFNFKQVDEALDYLVRDLGFDLTLTLESMPASIATQPDQSFKNHYPSKDYAKYEEAIAGLIAHWIERYGRETVGRWLFECWNEPSSSGFFKGTLDDYLKIVTHFFNALDKVEQRTGLRCRAATASDVAISPWYRPVWDQLRKTGQLKYASTVSMHVYGGYVSSFYSISYYLGEINRWRRERPELRDGELHITEYNGDSMSNRLNDRPAAAAYNIKANRLFLDSGVTQAYYFGVADFLYGQYDRHFKGGLGVYTRTGIAKPVLHSFRFLDRLRGGRRLPLVSTNDPLDGIAVLSEDGKSVRICLSSFAEADLDDVAPIAVRLNLRLPAGSGMPPGSVEALFFDEKTGNSHAEFIRLGSPESKPKDPLYQLLNPKVVPGRRQLDGGAVRNGVWTIEFTMPLNSGMLLEIPLR